MSNYAYFREQTRALPGFGAERKELLAELRQEELTRDHLIIQGSATRVHGKTDTAYADARAANTAAMQGLVVRLYAITKESK